MGDVMWSSQVLNGIIGCVVGIVGLLLVISRLRPSRSTDWRIGLGVPLFAIGLFILITELPQYALGFGILATLAMAWAALINIKQRADQEEARRKEGQLKEIAQWSADVRKYCSSLDMGFNTPMERSKAAETYHTLKFDGKNLLIAVEVEKETLGDNLQEFLRSAIELFDGPSWSSLADNKDKQRQLETVCETVIETAFELLRKQ